MYFKFNFVHPKSILRLISKQFTTLVTRLVPFQGEVEIVLHNGNRIEVIKNTLSVIHEDEIIFNFDNRKTPYVMVTNF